MSTFVLIPAEGLKVRDPITKEPLPKGGARKPRSRYWMRRVAEGSCSIAQSDPPTPADAPANEES